ncbi:MAG TPA: ATP-binding cassette domain-containing protein [Holophagaceae bacterium]|nr:ATP-binding cassette domain-containing protein [Holophagaceae bacterium]
MPESIPELRLEDIHLDGPDGRPVLTGIDLHLRGGEALLLSGGSGFSRGQFLRMCGGLTEPGKGRVLLSGVQLWPGEGLAALRGQVRIGLAFGQGGLVANLSLLDNLELPLLFGSDQSRERIRDRVMEHLDRFGLAGLADMRPHLLDARSTRLANLIRVKLVDPEIVLLDEPFEELEARDMAEIRIWMEDWLKTPGHILVVAADDPDPRTYPKLPRAELRDHRLMEAA